MRILGIGNARSVIFLRWAWRLVERGHSVFVVSDRFSAVPGESRSLEVFDIRRLDRLTLVPGVRRLRFGSALRELVAQLGIDVVHGHYLLPYGFWASLVDGVPVVVSPWGTDVLVDAQRPGRDRRRAVHALTRADCVVVNSAVSAARSIELGADPDGVEQIIWYADLERFGPTRFDPGLRRRLGWPEGALIMLSLRNFRPDTNIDLVVRAFRQVVDRLPCARLVLAAKGGPTQASVERLVDQLGLSELVAFVSVDEEALPGLVASADVLVAMTRSDSTPASLLEAMASGLPAVCAQAASVDEWLEHGRGGLLLRQGDVEGLAGGVVALLSDRELRSSFGEHNRRLVRLRVEAPGPALEQLYQRLLDGPVLQTAAVSSKSRALGQPAARR
jgi:glycosyltransferase involved in cell wall biosynthesis